MGRLKAYWLPSHITNTGIHNLSNYPLSEKEILVLSLGQSFIPTPRMIPDLSSYIDSQFTDYRRRCSLTRYFDEHPALSHRDPRLRIKGSTWLPPLSDNDVIFRYLNDVHRELSNSVRKINHSFHKRTKHQHHTPSWVYTTLQRLRNNKDIIITDADKNMGICVISTQQYITEGLRQLNDSSTYHQLDNPPNFTAIKDELENILSKHNRLYAPKTYNTQPQRLSELASYVLQTFGPANGTTNSSHLRLGHFYLLMKVHKQKVVGRPIVSSINTCSYYASKYIDAMLQPLLRRLSSFVQSSAHLIHILQNTPVPPNFRKDSVLLCADIDSLYPNIPLEEGLTLFRDSIIFNNDRFSSLDQDKLSMDDIDLICDLTKWVLHNNYFKFGERIFHQINGTAMGTPCAVVFACFFIDALERKVLSEMNLSPILYRRYIDDIFAIFATREQGKEFLERFNTMFPTIHCSSPTINQDEGIFLDATVYRPSSFDVDGYYYTRLFQKKQNKYLYIPPFSFHSRSIFPAFILAEINRYRLLCTDDVDFMTACDQFQSRLVDRGYDIHFLQPLFSSLPNRQSLLTKVAARFSNTDDELTSKKKSNSSPQPFIFKTINSPQTRLLNIANCLLPPGDLTQHPAIESFFIRKPIVSFKNAPSISTYFSHARKSLHNSLS